MTEAIFLGQQIFFRLTIAADLKLVLPGGKLAAYHILNSNDSTIFHNILASKLSTTPKIFSGRNRWFPTVLLAF
jgi:hypothetical protein